MVLGPVADPRQNDEAIRFSISADEGVNRFWAEVLDASATLRWIVWLIVRNVKL